MQYAMAVEFPRRLFHEAFQVKPSFPQGVIK
jgi:hypothetical protein